MTPRIHRLSIIAIAIMFAGVVFFPTVSTTAAESAPATFTPEVDIPGLFSGPQKIDDSLLARYIKAVYTYLIWTIGILATVMITYGGVKWVAAAGNTGTISDARDIINNAIIGVIIALTSFVLLNTISPNYTTLTLPSVVEIGKQYFDGAIAPVVCKSSLSVKCGSLSAIGKTKDRNGQEVVEYCMGTKCEKSGITGTDIVCDLKSSTLAYPDQSAKTTLAPGGGCVENVFLNLSQEGLRSGFQKLKVDHKLICGQIHMSQSGNEGFVSNKCPDTDDLVCYTFSPVNIVSPGEEKYDYVAEMYCPYLNNNGGYSYSKNLN